MDFSLLFFPALLSHTAGYMLLTDRSVLVCVCGCVCVCVRNTTEA